MEAVTGWSPGRDEDPEAMSVPELSAALAELGDDEAALAQRWLRCLAEFDRRQGWAADGMLSCVDWLVHRCGLARATAYEKLRVARELRNRPLIDTALGAGELTWCHVRAITRMTGADDDVDRALLAVARAGTVADLEAAVRHWQLLDEQEHPPPEERALRERDVRVRRQAPGLTRVEGGWATIGNPLDGTLTFVSPQGHQPPRPAPGPARAGGVGSRP